MLGKNLSHYKILEELGRGGMGIVYKAEDTKLDRTVAIKVLPSAALASDDDRARFYREAKAAAQLHHPHIASVFEIDEAVPEGSKDDDLRPFIAMEYIEGKTLDAKIKEGPFKLEDAIRIASEIASALEAAHKKDIVHRDIKSQNVMLTEEGSAKVLDFGLAQTAQSTKLTRMGSTLGTIAYMSPEQARSEEVDRRTDIWSLGVVIYEMIAGKHPFPGDYEQAAVYSILNEEPPPLTAIRTGVPMELERIVAKCLAKDVERRYQHSDELIADLGGIDSESFDTAHSSIRSGTVTTTQQSGEAPAGWNLKPIIATGAAVAIALIIFFVGRLTAPTETQYQNLLIRLPAADQILSTVNRITDPLATISRNGSKIAYWGANDNDDGSTSLYVMDINGDGTERMLGSMTVRSRLAFSPEGNWIAYSSTNSLDKIALAGGAPIQITDGVTQMAGLHWSKDGHIYYSPDYGRGVLRVLASGGETEPVTTPDPSKSEVGHACSQYLSGSNKILSTIYGDGFKIALIDLDTGARQIIIDGQCATFVAPNILLYVQGPLLMAAPFDPNTGELKASITVATDLNVDIMTMSPNYSVSDTGDLLYVSGTGDWDLGVIRRNFDGTIEETDFNQPAVGNIRVSSDGKRILGVAPTATSDADIYMYNVETNDTRKLTFDAAWDSRPVWFPDNQHIAFSSERAGQADIYKMNVSNQIPELIYQNPKQNYVTDVSPDGQYVAYHEGSQDRSFDVMALAVADTSKIIPIATTPSHESDGAFSPDGMYVAYVSADSRSTEIYVVAFPIIGDRTRISTGGGDLPKWSTDGRYVYYLSQGDLFRRRVENGHPISESVHVLSDVRGYWDLIGDEDGIITSGEPPNRTFRLIRGWVEDVRKQFEER